MLQRVRRFAVKLHKDESGPNTVEWILLIIVALILLVFIHWFVHWVTTQFTTQVDAVKADPFLKDKPPK